MSITATKTDHYVHYKLEFGNKKIMDQKICDKTNQILTCAALPHPSSFLPITAKMLPQAKLLDPWILLANFVPFLIQLLCEQHVKSCRERVVRRIAG